MLAVKPRGSRGRDEKPAGRSAHAPHTKTNTVRFLSQEPVTQTPTKLLILRTAAVSSLSHSPKRAPQHQHLAYTFFCCRTVVVLLLYCCSLTGCRLCCAPHWPSTPHQARAATPSFRPQTCARKLSNRPCRLPAQSHHPGSQSPAAAARSSGQQQQQPRAAATGSSSGQRAAEAAQQQRAA